MAFNHLVTTLRSALRWEGQPVRPYVHPSQYRAPENVRLYSDGMHKLYEPSFLTLAISVVTLGLYVGVPHILLALLAFSWWRPAAITLGLLLVSLLLPAKPLRLPSVLSSYVFLCWRRYFKFSYLFEKSLDCYQVRQQQLLGLKICRTRSIAAAVAAAARCLAVLACPDLCWCA